MAIKVHGIAVSPYTARVLLCLHEKGLDYELLPVDLASGAHKQHSYLSLNPFGSVPALQDGEVSLFGKMVELNTRSSGGSEMNKLGKVLDVYEERLSKSKYLAGESYSLADMHHIPILVYFMGTAEADAITSRPHVSAWWDDFSSRPATAEVTAKMKL
ncbi:Glutathione S-transferase F7 [Morella rubra]|uniref:glutathione transferase n=1 Tax=Morella rubra TaxID=262757 RepID=A0A6A1VMA9_9ROSI|nr:Glutathione S-transferase F7 [Morella rubra]